MEEEEERTNSFGETHEDEERVNIVLRSDEVDDGDRERKDDLRNKHRQSTSLARSQRPASKPKLTQSLLILGFESKKMKLNAVANAIHNANKPNPNLVKLLIGVKFVKALALKNLGKVSCSIAR